MGNSRKNRRTDCNITVDFLQKFTKMRFLSCFIAEIKKKLQFPTKNVAKPLQWLEKYCIIKSV